MIPKHVRVVGPLATATALIALAVGCGEPGPPPLAKVHGKVTHKGEPLTTGSVLFVPVAPKAEGSRDYPAGGPIGPDGGYELTTVDPGDGAAVGDHKVVVISVSGGAAAPSGFYEGDAPKGKSAKPATLKSLIPEKYAAPETTPLSYTVVAGDNTFDIDIPD